MAFIISQHYLGETLDENVTKKAFFGNVQQILSEIFKLIAKLTGLLDRIYDEAVLIDVNGVGYKVLVSKSTLQQMPALSQPLILWTETVMRNEQPHLCGFLEEVEAEWFTTLTQVQGVGAKVALSILSTINCQDLLEAIINQKSAILGKADGVGPKLASRIVLELKGKKSLPVSDTATTYQLSKPDINSLQEADDVISALINLGYSKNESAAAVAQAMGKISQPITLENLLKAALQEFKRYG
jgi:Holliday junction DNA helicase RuvA